MQPQHIAGCVGRYAGAGYAGAGYAGVGYAGAGYAGAGYAGAGYARAGGFCFPVIGLCCLAESIN